MSANRFQFETIFIPQDEGGFTAEVPDLPGCISEGDTLKEAEKNIHEAINLYLETLEERGIPLPQREPEKMYKLQITVFKAPSIKQRYAKTPSRKTTKAD